MKFSIWQESFVRHHQFFPLSSHLLVLHCLDATDLKLSQLVSSIDVSRRAIEESHPLTLEWKTINLSGTPYFFCMVEHELLSRFWRGCHDIISHFYKTNCHTMMPPWKYQMWMTNVSHDTRIYEVSNNLLRAVKLLSLSFCTDCQTYCESQGASNYWVGLCA